MCMCGTNLHELAILNRTSVRPINKFNNNNNALCFTDCLLWSGYLNTCNLHTLSIRQVWWSSSCILPNYWHVKNHPQSWLLTRIISCLKILWVNWAQLSSSSWGFQAVAVRSGWRWRCLMTKYTWHTGCFTYRSASLAGVVGTPRGWLGIFSHLVFLTGQWRLP